MNYTAGAPRVQDFDPVWLACGDFQIFVPDPLKKCPAFFFKAVLVLFAAARQGQVSAARPIHAGGNVGVHQDRKVRPDVAAKNAMQGQDRLAAQSASAALVGLRGVGEAVAENEFSFSDAGQNHFFQMLRARGEHQREFGLRRKPAGGGVQQHFTDFLADGRTARFARDHDRNSHVAQRPRQLLQLRAFAAAIHSFDGDEPAALGMGRHGRIIAKRELLVRTQELAAGRNGTRLCPVSPGSVVLLPSATCSSVTCELRRKETEWCYRQPPPHCTPGWSPVQTMPALVLSKERANRALLTALGSAVTLAVIFTIFDSNIEVARVPAGLYS